MGVEIMPNELYADKYCPKDIKSYIGFDHPATIQYIERVLKNQEKKKGMIFYGSAGVGKSVLANLLSKHFNISQYYTNASDKRKKGQINADIFRTESLKNKKTLIIFDECDGLSPSGFRELEKTIKRYFQPVILICNDIDKIPYSLRKICAVEKFTVDKFTLLALANRIVKAEGLALTRDDIKKIVDRSKSFRAVLHSLQFGMGTNPPEQLSTDTAVLYSLQGQDTQQLPTSDISDLIIRMNDNSSSPNLIALADLWNHRYVSGYTYGKRVARAILSSIRNPGIKKLEYPRTYRLLYESKHGKKMKAEATSENKSKPKIRITGFK